MTVAAGSLEEFLRAMLNAALNGTGRVIQEYRLRVEPMADGEVLTIALVPDGFEGMSHVYVVRGNDLELGHEAITQEVEAVLVAGALHRQTLDLAQQARDEAIRSAAGQAEIAARHAEKEAADRARPADISKSLPGGDPVPAAEPSP